jgi:hypothetical protein
MVVGADHERVARERRDAADPQPGGREQQDDGAVLLAGQAGEVDGVK